MPRAKKLRNGQPLGTPIWIRVTDKTHDAVIREAGRLTQRDGRQYSVGDVIELAFNSYMDAFVTNEHDRNDVPLPF